MHDPSVQVVRLTGGAFCYPVVHFATLVELLVHSTGFMVRIAEMLDIVIHTAGIDGAICRRPDDQNWHSSLPAKL
jgi:hypothetical protein